MSDSPAPQLDAAAVRRLVEEVIRRLHEAPAPAAAIQIAEPSRITRPIPGQSAAQPAILPDAVVSLAHIERLPAGTRQVMVAARAVVTPSARDRAREAGIVIARAPTAAAPAAAAARPFVIAQADCRGDAAGRAAAIARAVPHAQRLPATGLADVVAALAMHATRDAARGVLLTSRPAVAVVLANRSASLRAATGRDAASLAAAAADCAATLLVVDPAGFAGGLERVCADFAARPTGAVPAELAGAPTACACTTHPH